MVPLAAEILTKRLEGDERTAVRRSLRLGVSAHSSGDVAMALVLDISETGLLLETVVELAVGETLQVDIPEAGAAAIQVVWTDGLLAGCEFRNAISTAVVSAAQLKSRPDAGSRVFNAPSKETELRIETYPQARDDAPGQVTVVMITTLVAVLALVVFVAAIVSL